MYQRCLLYILLTTPAFLIAQESLKSPVVLIRARTETGAGILVGNEGSTLYLITAYHLIEQNPDAIEIGFYPGSRLRSRAQIEELNPRFDLAILSCTIPVGYRPPLSFVLAPDAPEFRQPVTVIGHPGGNEWIANVTNAVNGLDDQKDDRFFTISSQGILPGNSGGPVLDGKYRLLGMVQKANTIQTVCLRSTQLLNNLKGIPTNLLRINKPNDGNLSHLKENLTDINSTAPDAAFSNFVDPILDAEMVLIPGGSFSMGSSIGGNDEQPIHQVEVPDFFISKFEITQDQWFTVMGKNPGPRICREGKCPVDNVSFWEVKKFISKLNQYSEYKYRLPSESEWEYAAKGGPMQQDFLYAGSNNPEKFAWHRNNSGGEFHPVGELSPNQLGLYDMSGNVWEWCEDYWYESYEGAPIDGSPRRSPIPVNAYRVMRGGGYADKPAHIRTAHRGLNATNRQYRGVGFRLALTPPPK